MSRFDYVKYDETALVQQELFKSFVAEIESCVEGLAAPRPRAIILTKLEELYMWIGKAIRDDQIERSKKVAAILEDIAVESANAEIKNV